MTFDPPAPQPPEGPESSGSDERRERLRRLLEDYEANLFEPSEALPASAAAADASEVDAAELAASQRVIDSLMRLASSAGDEAPDLAGAAGAAEPAALVFADGASAGSTPRRLGRFHIVRELGRGGLGVVFLADDPLLKRQVALKLPRPEALLTPELRKRFVREAQAAARLDHPNVVPIYEVGQIAPFCYLASAYCAGVTLAAWLRRQTEPVPPRLAARLVGELAAGVDYANRQGVLHRDLKPANVLLDFANGSAGTAEPGAPSTGKLPFVPRISDFGLAKVEDMATAETRSGLIMGTPAYMAPEQARGQRHLLGPATDVYGLGAILFEMLTGRAPFGGASDADTLVQVIQAPPPELRTLRPDVPADLEAICLKCLAKLPEHRYASAGELGADLARFLADRPTLARPLVPAGRLLRWLRRQPLRSALVGASLMLVATLGLLSVGPRRDSRREPAGTAARPRSVSGGAPVEAVEAALHRREAHLNQVAAAHAAWLASDLNRAHRLLDDQRPAAGESDLRGFAWGLVNHLATGSELRLEHACPVYCADFSAAGSQLATAAEDGWVRLWDVPSGQLQAAFPASDGSVNVVAYLPDGQRLITVGEEPFVRLWDLDTVRDYRPPPDPLGPTAAPPPPDQAGFRRPTARWEFLLGHTLESHVESSFLGRESFLGRFGNGTARLEVDHLPPHEWLTIEFQLYVIGTWDGDESERWWVRADNGPPLVETTFRNIAPPENRALELGDAQNPLVPRVRLRLARRNALGFVVGNSPVAPPADAEYRVRIELPHRGDRLRLEFGAAGLQGVTDESWGLDHLKVGPSANPPQPEEPLDNLLNSAEVGSQGEWFQALAAFPVPKFPPRVQEIPLGYGADCLAIAPDGRRLAVHDRRGLASIIELASGRRIGEVPYEGQYCRAFAFLPDGRLAIAEEGRLRLWSVDEARTLASHPTPHGSEMSLALAGPGTSLATADAGGYVSLWEIAPEPRLISTLREHSSRVDGLAWAPNGLWLASTGDDERVVLWDTTTRQVAAHFRGHTADVWHARFSPDSRRLATSSSDGTVRLWNVDDTTDYRQLPTHQPPTAMALSPRESAVAYGTASGEVALLKLTAHEPPLIWTASADPLVAIDFHADGGRLATLSARGEVAIWRTDNRERVAFFSVGAGASILRFAPGGETLLVAGEEVPTRAYHCLSGESLPTDAPPERMAVLLMRGSRGDSVGYRQSSPELLLAAPGRPLRTQIFPSPLTAICPSGDGRRLVLALASRELVVLDAAAGREQFRLPKPNDDISALALHPDGETLAVALGSEVVVCDLPTRREVLRLVIRPPLDWPTRARQLHFSATGDQLLARVESPEGTPRMIMWETLGPVTEVAVETIAR